jgi:agmatinase
MTNTTARKVQLLGLPQDNNSSYLSGPAYAPNRIREAIHCSSANMFSETGIDLANSDLWSDSANVPLEGLSGCCAFDEIYQHVKQLIDDNQLVMSLGGDHSVAFPSISAHLDKYPNLNILHFDAHPDLYHDMLDNHYSHASPFARLMETGKVKRLVQVGIRTLTKHQREQADKFNVEIHEMRDLSKVSDISFDGPVYLSFDLDALDPAFAPGVSHFEPGGLSVREALNMIQQFKGQLVGADVVELNPLRDPTGMTAMVGAKLCKELMARLLIDNDLATGLV